MFCCWWWWCRYWLKSCCCCCSQSLLIIGQDDDEEASGCCCCCISKPPTSAVMLPASRSKGFSWPWCVCCWACWTRWCCCGWCWWCWWCVIRSCLRNLARRFWNQTCERYVVIRLTARWRQVLSMFGNWCEKMRGKKRSGLSFESRSTTRKVEGISKM